MAGLHSPSLAWVAATMQIRDSLLARVASIRREEVGVASGPGKIISDLF